MARFRGLDEGDQGSEKIFMFRIHIWIPREISSILSRHTRSETEILPQHKQLSGAFGAKFGPNVVRNF